MMTATPHANINISEGQRAGSNPSPRKVIVRVKGGLGNQLFGYAAARRLAWANDAELVIDDVSGFARDHQYQRRYELNHFRIPARVATSSERLEPFERYHRALVKWRARRRSFSERRYIEQEHNGFDSRLLGLTVREVLYLDGIWASPAYFDDAAEIIRNDLQLVAPDDSDNQRMAERIRRKNSVAVHVRWFQSTRTGKGFALLMSYYARAIDLIEQRHDSPEYFVFSDDPASAMANLPLPLGRTTLISHNSNASSYADLWLMTQCRAFVTANSTFSWWGAWLGNAQAKLVVSPQFEVQGNKVCLWNASVEVPQTWLQI
jgi:hypothetical protein